MPSGGTLTVLFTDLVDSTALMTRLGPERFDAVLAEHDALVNAAISGNSGTHVKHTGDGVMAVFNGAADALNAAVAIQQAVERRSRRAREPFMVRAGLSVGDVTEKDGDYFGPAPVEAARLCARADGGQVLAAEVVKVLAGSRGEHEFVSLGSLELKGLPPLATVEVRWEPTADAPRAPLPAAFIRDDGVDLVGRDSELQRILDVWARTTHGAPQIAMLTGEPGIGKTRLATELARRVHAEGGIVLLGRCEDGFGAPYKPFAEVVAGAMTVDSAELTGWAERHGSDVSRISRAVRERLPQIGEADSIDPDTARVRTCEGIAALLRTVSDADGALVVLDDLHWADESSLLLLRHLARTDSLGRVIVLGTYRDSEAGVALAGALADVRRTAVLTHISLRGLSDADTASLIAKLSADTPDTALIDSVRSDTEGNPFFVREAVAHYEESGEIGASEGVRQLVGQRLGRLSEPTQRLLGVAAVIGREFDLKLLAAITADSEDVLLDRLDEASATGLIAERDGYVGRFGFSHALVRATLIDGLGATRRVRMHQRVGEAIETMYAGDVDAHVAELAYHFGEAAAAVPNQAARYAVLAGKWARLAGSIAESQAAFERALEFLDALHEPDDTLRFDALIELAWAISSGPDPSRATAPMEAAFGLARTLESSEWLVQVAMLVPELLNWGVTLPEAGAVLDEATRAVAPDDFATRARLLSSRAAATMFSNPTLAEWLEAEADARLAIELAHRSGDIVSRFWALLTLNDWLWPGPDAVVLLETLQEGLAVFQELGFHGALWTHEWRVALAHLRLGDRASCDALPESHAKGLLDQAALEMHRATIAIAEGRWDDARRHTDAALDRVPNNPKYMLGHFEQNSRIRSEQGRTNASLLLRLAEDLPEFPALRVEASLATAEADDRETAMAMLGQLADDAFAVVPHDYGRTLVLRQLSELVAHVGTPEHATALFPLLAPYDGQILLAYTGTSIEGAAARGLGQLETVLRRYGEAEAHFEAAIELEERIRGRICLPRTKYWYARMLLARADAGDAERAAVMLDDVIAETSEIGMVALEAQARALR